MTAITKVGFAFACATVQGLCSIVPFLGLAAAFALGVFLESGAIDLGVIAFIIGPLLGSLLAAAISFVSYSHLYRWIAGSEAKSKAIVWILLSILTSGPFWGGFLGFVLISMVVSNVAVQMLLVLLSMAGIWVALVVAARAVGASLGSVPAK
jgi:hypothetical protein